MAIFVISKFKFIWFATKKVNQFVYLIDWCRTGTGG